MRISQSDLIYTYIVRVAFTNYQGKTNAVAQLKRNDFQEVLRELEIAGMLSELALQHPEYVSSSYINYAKSSKMVTAQETAATISTPDPTRMTYFLYPQVVSYEILSKYPPTGKY